MVRLTSQLTGSDPITEMQKGRPLLCGDAINCKQLKYRPAVTSFRPSIMKLQARHQATLTASYAFGPSKRPRIGPGPSLLLVHSITEIESDSWPLLAGECQILRIEILGEARNVLYITVVFLCQSWMQKTSFSVSSPA
jgi:hypothetical protein